MRESPFFMALLVTLCLLAVLAMVKAAPRGRVEADVPVPAAAPSPPLKAPARASS